MAVGEDVLDLRSRLGAVAADPALDPSQRIRELRRLRDEISGLIDREPRQAVKSELRFLLGHADTYIGDNELRREAGALRHALARVELYENADLRAEMIEDGFAPDALDAAGYFSHEQLAAMEEDGTLPEVASERGSM